MQQQMYVFFLNYSLPLLYPAQLCVKRLNRSNESSGVTFTLIFIRLGWNPTKLIFNASWVYFEPWVSFTLRLLCIFFFFHSFVCSIVHLLTRSWSQFFSGIVGCLYMCVDCSMFMFEANDVFIADSIHSR